MKPLSLLYKLVNPEEASKLKVWTAYGILGPLIMIPLQLVIFIVTLPIATVVGLVEVIVSKKMKTQQHK